MEGEYSKCIHPRTRIYNGHYAWAENVRGDAPVSLQASATDSASFVLWKSNYALSQRMRVCIAVENHPHTHFDTDKSFIICLSHMYFQNHYFV